MLNKIKYFLPTIKQCWVIVFLMLIAGGILAAILKWPVDFLAESTGTSINTILLYLIPMVPAFIYIIYKGQKTNDEHPTIEGVPLDNTNFGKLNFITFGILALIATIAMGVALEPLTSWMPMPEYLKELFEEMLNNSVGAFLAAVIAAPLVEEFFLRGVMERGLIIKTTPTKAILWSSFFFAFIHMNPWQAVPAFALGAFMGWIYYRTHSLKATIFIHFVNNGFAFLMMILFPDVSMDTTIKEFLNQYGTNIYPIVYVISIIIIPLIIYYFNKTFPKNGFENYKKYE